MVFSFYFTGYVGFGIYVEIFLERGCFRLGFVIFTDNMVYMFIVTFQCFLFLFVPLCCVGFLVL